MLATWFTFAPCFLWIFAGAPFIEATRDDRALKGALSAITAAVVGVILNLAVFFAYHVLWPNGLAGTFDWTSAAIALAAAVALFRFQRSVIQVIAGAAVLGLILKTLQG